VVEHLPSKHEALSQTPIPPKKKTERKKEKKKNERNKKIKLPHYLKNKTM
jgi:hypothetical protein